MLAAQVDKANLSAIALIVLQFTLAAALPPPGITVERGCKP